jgi:hypothetical protein
VNFVSFPGLGHRSQVKVKTMLSSHCLPNCLCKTLFVKGQSPSESGYYKENYSSEMVINLPSEDKFQL